MTAADAQALAAEQTVLSRWQLSQRDAARKAQREGRYPDAQQAWAVVLALDPADTEALAGLAEAQRAAAEAARESLRRAGQARAHGEAEAAMRLYLVALAQDPTSAGAADALRALELERARDASLRRGARPAQSRLSASAGDPPELEHADLLLAAGEIDAALVLLEPLARTSRADAALKRRACDLLLAQADVRPDQAPDFVQRCLRLLPQHVQALKRQRELRSPAPPAAQIKR